MRHDDPIEAAEVQSHRIREGRCPQCGDAIKDKGSYLRCVKCPWELHSGRFIEHEGFCVMYPDDYPFDEDGRSFGESHPELTP